MKLATSVGSQFNRLLTDHCHDNLSLSWLDVTFEVVRTYETTANTAIINIYNAKEETRNKILTKGSNVVLKAGYEDEGNIGGIFFGTIIESLTKKQGGVITTTVNAQDIFANKESKHDC